MVAKQHEITHFFEGIGVALKGLAPVEFKRGRHGKIEVFRHPELGKVFVLNGEIQHAEAWAPLYHEPLVHLPSTFVSEIKDVLILGGGTLFAAYEALKYKSVKHVVLLDHDPIVTKMVAQHYRHARDCLKDPRFALLHIDAYSFLYSMKGQFDLVINDGADLLPTNLRTLKNASKMFSAMTDTLRPDGVCADVVFRHLFEKNRIRQTIRVFRKRARFALSLVFLPEYHGVLHLLCIWGKKSSRINQALRTPVNQEQLSWIANPKLFPCTYYDPRFLHYYLHLPRYIKSVLSSKKTTA